jgi:hypothetical protein|tara:strand:- start:210 stop:455 length:246 start_codon:yes stop_codon:yes gene_type:complete
MIKELIDEGLLLGGIFENEGHILQFTLLDNDDVEIYEQLHSAFKTHKSRQKCSAKEALKKQQVLIKFKYQHYPYDIAFIGY